MELYFYNKHIKRLLIEQRAPFVKIKRKKWRKVKKKKYATTESWYSIPLLSTHPWISYALFDIGSFNFPFFPCPPFAARGAYYRRSFTLEIADFLEPVKGNLAPCSVTRLEIDACNARQLVGIIGTVSRML